MASEQAVAAVLPYEQMLSGPITEVAERLDAFAAMLERWNRTHNLVSRETIGPDLWTRHIADSLRILPLVSQRDQFLADVGSGGGFPAVPTAICLKGTGRRHLLIETNGRKASFLRAAARDLGLDIRVDTTRAEARDSRETADVVTARAVAPLASLFPLVKPLFAEHTRGVFHKGREYDVELEDAAREWTFDVTVHADATGVSDGVLLEVSNLRAR